MFNDELNFALPSRMFWFWFYSWFGLSVTVSRNETNHRHKDWQPKYSLFVIVFNWRIYRKVFVNTFLFNMNTIKSHLKCLCTFHRKTPTNFCFERYYRKIIRYWCISSVTYVDVTMVKSDGQNCWVCIIYLRNNSILKILFHYIVTLAYYNMLWFNY